MGSANQKFNTRNYITDALRENHSSLWETE